MINNSKRALSLVLKIIAILFFVMLGILVTIHFQIQKSTKEKVKVYLDNSGLSSNMDYGNIGKDYFPPAISISDVKINNSFGCFDNSIASMVIKNDGGIILKGVNFDVLNAVRCRFSNESEAYFKNYMKTYTTGWDTLRYPLLSLMLAGYRDISSDLEISFSEAENDTSQLKKPIKNFHMRFYVKDALDVSFYISYIDNKQNSIEDKRLEFVDSLTQNGNVNTNDLELFFNMFVKTAQISSVLIEYRDIGFIDNYKVFVDKLVLDMPSGVSDTGYVMKLGVLSVIQDMLENGMSLAAAEKIERSMTTFINSSDELHIISNSENPIMIKGNTWQEMFASYIVDAKLEFVVK